MHRLAPLQFFKALLQFLAHQAPFPGIHSVIFRIGAYLQHQRLGILRSFRLLLILQHQLPASAIVRHIIRHGLIVLLHAVQIQHGVIFQLEQICLAVAAKALVVALSGDRRNGVIHADTVNLFIQRPLRIPLQIQHFQHKRAAQCIHRHIHRSAEGFLHDALPQIPIPGADIVGGLFHILIQIHIVGNNTAHKIVHDPQLLGVILVEHGDIGVVAQCLFSGGQGHAQCFCDHGRLRREGHQGDGSRVA